MAVKVYVPGKSAGRGHANADAIQVSDGHLYVNGPDPLGTRMTHAIYAPSHWTRASVDEDNEPEAS